VGTEAHAKALALTRGVEWELLAPAGRAEMVPAAMGQLGLLAFAVERGLDWDSLSPSAREGLVSEAHNEQTHIGRTKQRTEATEARAQKIAMSEGKDWGSTWTLTQESYRDEAKTVYHNCYVGGPTPQTQKDAFHNLLTGVVRPWMGEDYWDDWMVDLTKSKRPPDID